MPDPSQVASSWRRRWRSSPGTSKLMLIGAGIVATIVLGLAMPILGGEIVAWILLIVAGLPMVSRPFLAVLLLTALIPLENLAMFAEGVTITRILGIGVLAVWFGGKLLRRERWLPLLTPGPFRATFILAILMFSSALWARESSVVFSGVARVLRLLMLSILIADLVSSWDRVAWLLRVMLIASLAVAVLTIEQHLQIRAYLAMGGETTIRAGDAISGTVNAAAYSMVVTVPFAFYLIGARSEGAFWRLIGSLYIPAAIYAVAVTISRSAIVLMGAIVIGQIWEMISGNKARRSWLVPIIGATVIALILIPQDMVFGRLQTLVPDLLSAITGTPTESGFISGRGSIYLVGLRIFGDRPLLGVGYQNFANTYAQYQPYVPGAIYRSVVSPHSSYLGFLTELGLPGLTLWLLIVGIALKYLVEAWETTSEDRRSRQFLLVRAVTYSFALQLAFAWIASVENEKFFWLLLGFTVAVRRLVDLQAQTNAVADSGWPSARLRCRSEGVR